MQSETKGSHVCNHHTTAAKLQKSIVTNYRLQKHLSSAIITYYHKEREMDKYLSSYLCPKLTAFGGALSLRVATALGFGAFAFVRGTRTRRSVTALTGTRTAAGGFAVIPALTCFAACAIS